LHSACHHPPPLLETQVEGFSLALCLPPPPSVTRNTSGGFSLALCQPPPPSIARNASGGVFPCTLPATTSLRRSKREWRGLPSHSACHHPPTSIRHSKRKRRVFPCSLPATTPTPTLETRAEGFRGVYPHTLPASATNPPCCSKCGGGVSHTSACHEPPLSLKTPLLIQ